MRLTPRQNVNGFLIDIKGILLIRIKNACPNNTLGYTNNTKIDIAVQGISYTKLKYYIPKL